MNKLILIIDDTPQNMKLFRDILQANGYSTIEAVDALKGIEMAIEQKPSLILMDIMLPVLSGFDAVRILKSDEKTKNIPVIALTSFAMPGDKERAVEAGFDGYITKPINVRGFLKEVAKMFVEA